MIHHLARAFFLRQIQRANMPMLVPAAQQAQSGNAPKEPQPVRPRPITPWTVPPHAATTTHNVIALRPHDARRTPDHAVRISSDPSDVRRTVITGRFAEVCAALDRLVIEQEAAA